jgi:predicted MPP superfamily phosphohydrolase
VLLEKDSLNTICIVGADEKGNLQQTLENCPQEWLKILLIHNSKDSQSQITENKEIALTISGHTHAMQCAYNVFGKRFSPAQWLFKHWDGLYSVDNQYFFITRGVGYAGVPVRMGFKPEVSILELRTKG